VVGKGFAGVMYESEFSKSNVYSEQSFAGNEASAEDNKDASEEEMIIKAFQKK
jgi:hypothetical protein